MIRLRFSVRGNPIAKERARTYAARAKNGGIIVVDGSPVMRTRTPDATRAWETYVSMICRQAAASNGLQSPPDSPVVLGCIIYRPIPKSWSDKKRKAAIDGEIVPTTKPDLSNYIKSIEDAGEGVLWRNDSQIIGYGAVDGVMTCKRYSDQPRVEIEVQFLERDHDVDH